MHELTADELLNLHRGQGLDLFWRDSLTCPTEEEYVQMVLGSECWSVHVSAALTPQRRAACSASPSSS